MDPDNPLAQALAEHAWTLADEMPRENWCVFDTTHELGDLEWSFHDARSDVESVTVENDGVVVFFAPTTATGSRRVARATRWQPAEYETVEIEFGVEVRFDPTGDDGFGSVEVEAGRR